VNKTSIAFILGLILGYEAKDLRRFLPFAVQAYDNIKAIATGEFLAELVVDDEESSGDE
jgi:hypothetical protein